MRIIIIGQAAFGEKVLQVLSKKGEEVVGAYTPPDIPGRTNPFKELAVQLGIPIHLKSLSVALCKSDMILRDFLAIDRTVLANQNTFLAYLRTALTLFVAGLTFVRFFDHSVVEIIGWIFVPLGVGTFAVGLLRYNRLRRVLKMIQTPPPGSGPSASQ